MAGNQGEAGIRQFSIHHMEIRPTDPTDVNLDEDLTRIRNRYGPLLKTQRTGEHVAGMVEYHRVHNRVESRRSRLAAILL